MILYYPSQIDGCRPASKCSNHPTIKTTVFQVNLSGEVD